MRPLIATVVWACLATALYAQAPTEKGRLGLSLAEIRKPWTGDLDGMVERRTVRVLTAYSRTLYFVDAGTPRGTAYDQGNCSKNISTRRSDRLACRFASSSSRSPATNCCRRSSKAKAIS